MYCEVEPDLPAMTTKLIFHRGSKDGPVLGTADSCFEEPHQTDIHVLSPNLVIPFKHKHHPRFEHNNKKYRWRGFSCKQPSELVEEDTSENVAATFEPSPFEGNRERIHAKEGTVITKQDIQDIVVMTVIVMQVREEEMMGPV
jgi:hypothetical protein